MGFARKDPPKELRDANKDNFLLNDQYSGLKIFNKNSHHSFLKLSVMF